MNEQKDLFLASREIEFDYGHRIQLHGSKCKNIHGHRGKIEATISGPVQTEGSSTGMVMDFGLIKELLMRLFHDVWDHALLLESTDPFYIMIRDKWGYEALLTYGLGKVVAYPFAPTAENLAYYAFTKLTQELAEYDAQASITLERITFYETPTCSATIDRRFLDNK